MTLGILIRHLSSLAGPGHVLFRLQCLGHSLQTVLQQLPAPGQHQTLAHLGLFLRLCLSARHPDDQVQDYVYEEWILGEGPQGAL